MLNLIIFKTLLLLVCLSNYSNCFCQIPASQAPIFNGREYHRFPFTVDKGTPYYKTQELAKGWAMYDGTLCTDVPLLYDQVADELVTKDASGANLVKLVKQKLDSFYLNETRFIAIHQNDRVVKEGYYELLYEGRSMLLKKEAKQIINDIRLDQQLKREIKSKITYYVSHNNQYYIVSGAVSFADIFKDKKEDIRKFLKDNKRKYKKAEQEELMKNVVAYYDQLNK